MRQTPVPLRSKKRATVAVAHSILVIAYHIIRDGTHYIERGATYFDPRNQQAIQTLLLDAGYDDATLLSDCANRGIHVLAPLSKPVGKSTAQDRRALAVSTHGHLSLSYIS